MCLSYSLSGVTYEGIEDQSWGRSHVVVHVFFLFPFYHNKQNRNGFTFLFEILSLIHNVLIDWLIDSMHRIRESQWINFVFVRELINNLLRIPINMRFEIQVENKFVNKSNEWMDEWMNDFWKDDLEC